MKHFTDDRLPISTIFYCRFGFSIVRFISVLSKVSLISGDEEAFQTISNRLFGRVLRNTEIVGVTGAPDNASVQAGVLDDSLYFEYLETTKIGISGSCRIIQNGSGVLLNIDTKIIFQKHQRRMGIGLQCFVRQVNWCERLGIKSAHTFGGRDHNENGYYSWPRYGFDAVLPIEWRNEIFLDKRIPTRVKRAVSVLDVMATETGREFWRNQGIALALHFDCEQQSRSRRVLQNYWTGRQNDGEKRHDESGIGTDLCTR